MKSVYESFVCQAALLGRLNFNIHVVYEQVTKVGLRGLISLERLNRRSIEEILLHIFHPLSHDESPPSLLYYPCTLSVQQ